MAGMDREDVRSLRQRVHTAQAKVAIGKEGERAAEKVATPVGYTWIPLLEKGTLATGEHNLPVASEIPPPR